MQENIGYSVVDVQGDPINPNVVVVMGGLLCLNLDAHQKMFQR